MHTHTLPPEKLQETLRCLRLLQACPPTVRQVIEAGDEAIEAAGLNPWCLNEGLAEGDETVTPWFVGFCIKEIEDALQHSNQNT